MPIYEYRCESCGAHIEAVQKISDPPLEACSSCKDGRLVKLISNTSFVLKGGGWYADGYGSSGSAKSSDKPAASSTTKPAASTASSSTPSGGTGGSSGGSTGSSTGGDTKAA